MYTGDSTRMANQGSYMQTLPNYSQPQQQTMQQQPQQQTMQPQQQTMPQQQPYPQGMQPVIQTTNETDDFNKPHGQMPMTMVPVSTGNAQKSYEPYTHNGQVLNYHVQNAHMAPYFSSRNSPAQQQQQQQHQQMLIGEDGKIQQVPIDLKPVKVWTEVVIDKSTDKLVEDLKKIKNMNLLDDSSMFNVYLYHKGLTDLLILVSFLGSLYEKKYEELFDEYPGLLPWLYYSLFKNIVHGQRSIVEDSGVHKGEITKRMFGKFIEPKNRKRRLVEYANGVTKAVPVEQTAEAKPKNKSAKHILTTLSVYNDYPEAYTVGRFVDQLLPAEFAILSSTCSLRQTNVSVGATNSVSVVCGNITFAHPILIQMYARFAKNFLFIGGMNADKLIEAASEMTGGQSVNGLTVGIKKEQQIVQIESTHGTYQKMDNEKFKDPDQVITCVLSYVRCSINNNNTIGLHGYANKFYMINQKNLKSEENEKTLIEIMEKHEHKLLENMDVYDEATGYVHDYDNVEEDVTSLPPQLQQQSIDI